MIQRIQSVFLFASLCFLVPMFFLPIAELVHENGEMLFFDYTGFSVYDSGSTYRINNQYSIMAFGILICALNLVTIFLYNIRLLQIRLCIYNMLLLTGLIGITFFVVYGVNDITSISFRLPVVFPVVSIILQYLAFRGIRKDHFMVEALTRLR